MILTFLETKNGILRKNALAVASYCCEINKKFNIKIIGVTLNNISEENEKHLQNVSNFMVFSKMRKDGLMRS